MNASSSEKITCCCPPLTRTSMEVHATRRASSYFQQTTTAARMRRPDDQPVLALTSRCDIRTRACTTNSTPRAAVAFWRKGDKTRSCSSRGGPRASRAFVGTPQPIPAKTDQPNEPLHNPAQPAQLHGSTDPEDETAHSDPAGQSVHDGKVAGLESETESLRATHDPQLICEEGARWFSVRARVTVRGSSAEHFRS
jgi:hypothetical protein